MLYVHKRQRQTARPLEGDREARRNPKARQASPGARRAPAGLTFIVREMSNIEVSATLEMLRFTF